MRGAEIATAPPTTIEVMATAVESATPRLCRTFGKQATSPKRRSAEALADPRKRAKRQQSLSLPVRTCVRDCAGLSADPVPASRRAGERRTRRNRPRGGIPHIAGCACSDGALLQRWRPEIRQGCCSLASAVRARGRSRHLSDMELGAVWLPELPRRGVSRCCGCCSVFCETASGSSEPRPTGPRRARPHHSTSGSYRSFLSTIT